MYFEKVAAMISEKFEMPVEEVTRETNIIDDLGAEYPAANHPNRFFKFQMINYFEENDEDSYYTLDATGIFGIADGKVTFTDVDTEGDGYDNTDYFDGNEFDLEEAQ